MAPHGRYSVYNGSWGSIAHYNPRIHQSLSGLARQILVTGATGNQGGAVAKLLLQHSDQYRVRCLTRNTESSAAKVLADHGAVLFMGDLADRDSLARAIDGCWGVFAVTNFYDSTIVNDPYSEEQQGRNLAQAAKDAGVECFVWSTLPSSKKLSGGTVETRIYEGKHAVDSFVRELELPGVFVLTGNFYENMVLRGHMQYDSERDSLVFKQAIIQANATLAMLYVEKDLSAIVKSVFDAWTEKKEQLKWKYLHACDARATPSDVIRAAEKVSGKKCEYVVLPTTGWEERDKMFALYNEIGMYPGVEIPDPQVLDLGVKLHNVEDYMRERLLPHLGLKAVS